MASTHRLWQNGYIAWRPMYVCDNISPNFSWNEECFTEICRDNKNTHVCSRNSSWKSCCLWDYVEKFYRAGEATDDITRCMRYACWITKSTNTHLEHWFFMATLVTRTRLIITLYAHSLPCSILQSTFGWILNVNFSMRVTRHSLGLLTFWHKICIWSHSFISTTRYFWY
jgi:hypothetical protein